METLIIITGIAVIGAILYLVSVVKNSRKEEVDINSVFEKLDTNLQKSLLEQLHKLNGTVSENLKEGRGELRQMQHQSQESSQKIVQGLLDQIQDKMEKMNKGMGQLSKTNDFMQMLFNPASRGKVGEVQLASLLKEVLAPNQYEENFRPDPSAGAIVEFAVKMPSDLGESMYLPIDSKFPKEEYERLMTAETRENIEKSTRALKAVLKENAKRIAKYINVPRTTDLAIMYLPAGIYDWVIGQVDLVEKLRQDHKIVVTGPNNLWAMLSFVSYFYRLMVINDNSKEVWDLLSVVKKEMNLNKDELTKLKKYLSQAVDKVETLETTRFNVLMKQLKNVSEATDQEDSDSQAA